ncbi:MAG: hypothetical protein HQM14_21205 [SAR324 cluster bacterium]|nr:hypothetical protein [SAR324 cluster bacterium]
MLKILKSDSEGGQTQQERAALNGISVRNQAKVDKLEKYRPDLLRLVRRGRMTIGAAAKAAGWELKRVQVPCGNDDMDAMRTSKQIIKHFPKEMIEEIYAELQTFLELDGNQDYLWQ